MRAFGGLASLVEGSNRGMRACAFPQSIDAVNRYRFDPPFNCQRSARGSSAGTEAAARARAPAHMPVWAGRRRDGCPPLVRNQEKFAVKVLV